MANRNATPTPIAINGFWHLCRRVPNRYAHLDPRRLVRISTGIRVVHDPRATEAKKRVLKLDEALLEYWFQLAEGGDRRQAELALNTVKQTADLKLPPLTIEDARVAPLSELYHRLIHAIGQAPPEKTFGDLSDTPSISKAQAAIGGTIAAAAAPRNRGPKVREMIAEYQRINATSLAAQSKEQMRQWKTPRSTALNSLLEFVDGDLHVEQLTTEHVHPFRSFWQDRVLAGEIRANSANRMMKHVAGLYGAIHSHYLLDVRNPFKGILLRDGEDGSRPPYDTDFIQDHILAEGMFATIGEELRRLIYLAVETGLRPSESCSLTKDDIILDANVPHVLVTDTHRRTKTKGSVRAVPLVGVALRAMQLQPNGFPKYFDKPNQASTRIGMIFQERNLKPTPKHSLYSLRHSLMDRLRDAGAGENVQKDIAGHKYLYGKGTSLEVRYQWMKKIALRPPKKV